MNYFNILKFKKEPFSNSPEPEFLFQLSQYSDCLQKLELAVRLRRGINVIIGDIGTGKTTLCRKLIQNFSASSTDSAETEIETHLLLDPAFNSTIEFLKTICIMLGMEHSDNSSQSEWHLKEKIKNYLFNKGVDEKRIVVLIIDEGQKIPKECLELLREFLNYETNQFKLLQIIIFAQKEFHTVLKKKANLLDRINLLYHLRPLNFKQTRAMINYRLSVARDFEDLPSLFSFWGFVAIYLATKGYPRKIVFLCHQVVLKMIIREKDSAGWFLVRSCISRSESPFYRRLGWTLAGFLMIVVLGISVSAITLSTMHLNMKNKLADHSVHQKELPLDDDNMNNIKMPDAMGKISMTPKRTIWWTLQNIYGDTNPEIMQKMLIANPHLSDKRTVMVGTKLTLPSIPADRKSVKTGDIVIALEIGQDLEKMYNIFRNNYNERISHPMGFLSYWNKMEGFQFAVVIEKKFDDINSAEEMRRKLPPEIAAKAKIISQWNADTVFFRRRPLQY
jgi:general secretion pathway protein A